MVIGQDLLVYACDCGYRNADKKTFNTHLMNAGKKDGKKHSSMGRVNTSTGEVDMPPFDQRTKDQKKASTYAMNKKDGVGGSILQTEFVTAATQIKFVPRVLVCSLTPVMLAAWKADQELWGWPADMPFDSVIEQWAIHFHRDRGVELTAYVIRDPKTQESIRAQNLAAQEERKEAEKEEVTP